MSGEVCSGFRCYICGAPTVGWAKSIPTTGSARGDFGACEKHVTSAAAPSVSTEGPT